MSVLASIGEGAEWYPEGSRGFVVAGVLFVSVAITGTFATALLVVHSLALLTAAFLVIIAGYIAQSLFSTFLVGIGPYLGNLMGTVLRDTFVAGRIRGTYWLSVFTVHRIVFVVGATATLYVFGYILGELVRKIPRKRFLAT